MGGHQPAAGLKAGKVNSLTGRILLRPAANPSNRRTLDKAAVGTVLMDGDKLLVGPGASLVLKQRNGITQRFLPSTKWQVVNRKDSPEEEKLRQELEKYTALVKPRGGKDGVAWPTEAPASTTEFFVELEQPMSGPVTVEILRADGTLVGRMTGDAPARIENGELAAKLAIEQTRSAMPLRIRVQFGGRWVEHVLRLLPPSKERAFAMELRKGRAGVDEVQQRLMLDLSCLKFGQPLLPRKS